MARSLRVLLTLVAAAAFLAAVVPDRRYDESTEEGALWRMGELCTVEGEFFSGSGKCVNCHAPDPDGEALVDEHGATVSPVFDWQATMMANSARDPFWRAQVAREGLINPGHRDEIENTCTACHAPQGFHEARLTGGDAHYTMEDLLADDLGLDGVGCTGCHTIDNIGLAGRFNGDLPINPEKVAWGGFENPWDGLMSGQTGFIPAYGEHFRASEVCTSCHSLYSHTQDLAGETTGNVFFEQATYLEWVNSDFNAEGVQCQTCHMPLVEGGAIAATQPNWLFEQRFGRHHFVGGNAFMLKLMKDNAEQLDLSATPVQFDSTIARTLRGLQQETAALSVSQVEAGEGEVAFEVEVVNKIGHKFPSGYPARLAFLEFVLVDAGGDTLFASGEWSEAEGIAGRDLPYEPHHEEITAADEVQIYEFAFADVSGAETTILERAATVLKDNRLPPRGFTTSHAAYDTVAIGPAAAADANFNRWEGAEGTGADRVTYRVDVGAYRGTVEARVRLRYVSVPKRWVSGLLAASADHPDIEAFRAMYEGADRTPVDVAGAAVAGWTGFVAAGGDWVLVPNPAEVGQAVRLQPGGSVPVVRGVLYDAGGRAVAELSREELLGGFVPGRWVQGGTYLVQVETEAGTEVVRGAVVR